MDLGPPKKLLSMNFLEFVQSRDCRWRWKRQWERGIGKKCAAELEECKGQGEIQAKGGSGWRNTGREREEIHARIAKKYRQGVGRNTGKEREEILGYSRCKCRQAV